MEYVYAAMVLHAAGKEVNGENISKVLQAVGAEVDEARVKALTTALEGVNIDEAIKSAAVPAPAAPAAATPAEAPEEEKKEKKKEKEEKEEEKEELAGLGALFG